MVPSFEETCFNHLLWSVFESLYNTDVAKLFIKNPKYGFFQSAICNPEMWYTSGEITEAVGYEHLKKQLNNFISGVQPKRVHQQTCQLITLNFSYNSNMQF